MDEAAHRGVNVVCGPNRSALLDAYIRRAAADLKKRWKLLVCGCADSVLREDIVVCGLILGAKYSWPHGQLTLRNKLELISGSLLVRHTAHFSVLELRLLKLW